MRSSTALGAIVGEVASLLPIYGRVTGNLKVRVEEGDFTRTNLVMVGLDYFRLAKINRPNLFAPCFSAKCPKIDSLAGYFRHNRSNLCTRS